MGRQLNRINGNPNFYSAKDMSTGSTADRIEYLKGVDLTSAPINVDKSRAYNGLNMIRDVPGKVRKRMGYKVFKTFPERINGIFQYGNDILIHSGTKLFLNDSSHILCDDMNDYKSNAYLMYYDSNAMSKGEEVDMLVIMDGYKLRVYCVGSSTIADGIHKAEDVATVPDVTVGRAPNGEGGDSLQMVNMLTDKYRDNFLGTEDDTVYQLSYFPLNDESVLAEKIDDEGIWHDITETISSIDYTTGTVTFSEAPGLPPVTGEDNVRITASSEHEGYKDRINKCQFGIIYGLDGAWDRLFASGNPDNPDSDWYCNSADPLFWGDWNYGEIGKTSSPITGYTIVNGYLATHKAADDTERNCYLRKGINTYQAAEEGEEEDIDLQTTKFPIVEIIQGTGAVAPGSFAYMTEPMYLTYDGIYATTPYEYNNVLYAQKRSRLLDGALLEEKGLEDAVAINYNDFYMLAIGDKVYILDTLQRDTSNITRGSNYQYEGYHWNNVPVRCWFKMDGRLYFGAADGNVYIFYDNKYLAESYQDNGKPIYAKWEIMHSGRNIHLDKNMRYIAMNISTTNGAGITLHYRGNEDKGFYSTEFHPDTLYYTYSKTQYSKLTYGGSDRPKTIGRKVKIRKYDSCVLSFENNENKQGIFIYAIVIEYTEGNRHKGERHGNI